MSIQHSPSLVEKIESVIKETIFGKQKEKEPDIQASVNFFKSSSGTWKWIGTFTNNFRDHDVRPEIFKAAAHRRYVEKVDSGEKDLPYLYIFHEGSWKIGKASFVAIDEIEGDDDIVFVIAGGNIDADKYYVAEKLAKSGHPWQMSHAVPAPEVKRDKDDSSLFDDYWSDEVSIVPHGRAANPYTTFGVIGDSDMIADEKRQEINEILGDTSILASLEEANKALASSLKGKREFKSVETESASEEVIEETQPQEVPEETVEQPEATEEVEQPEATEEVEQPDNAAEEAGSELVDSLITMAKSLDTLTSTVIKQNERLNVIEKQLSEVPEEVSKEAPKEEKSTPQATDIFSTLVARIDKQSAALVADGDELAKQAPQETPLPKPQQTTPGVPNVEILQTLFGNGLPKEN